MFENFLAHLGMYPRLDKAFRVLVPIVITLIVASLITGFGTAAIIAVARLGVTTR